MKFLNIFGLFTMIVPLLLLQISCSPPEIVEVTREVQVEVEVTRIVEVKSEAQSISQSYSYDTYNEKLIIEPIELERFDEKFRLFISLPPGYENEPNKRYPVLYVTDGQIDTRMANLMVWNLSFERSVPDLIIVGIGYDIDNAEIIRDLRMRDLMPAGNQEGYGRAEDLLASIQNEIIPHIDDTYRTNPDRRFLAGYSAGGTFAIYTMFHASELFEGFVATSPALMFSDWSAFDEAETFAETHNDLPASLFISIGSEEGGIAIIEQFEVKMDEYGYENFKIKMVVLDGETHASIWPVGFQRGIKEIARSRVWK